jgi:hypothetical protein
MRCRLAVLAALWCLLVAPASAERRWMTVLLDGRKVGTLRIDRDADGGAVTTTQALDLRLTRANSPLLLRSSVTAVESRDGAPLAFDASGNMSALENRVEGRARPEGAFQVTRTVGGQSTVGLLIWPTGASLVEGQRLIAVARGFVAGTTYPVRNFDVVKQQVADVKVDVVGNDALVMPDGTRETLHHLRQSLPGVPGAAPVDVWVDDEGAIRRSISPLLGFRREMISCSEACATAPDQDVDVLRAAMIDAPRPLTPNFRVQPMRYTVRVAGGTPHPFIETDEQHVTSLGDGVYVIDVGFARRGKETAPAADDTAPSPWLQADSPRIGELARSIAGDAHSDLQRMRRLRAWVSDFIDRKGLDIGYASALETLDTRAGDCTEHAVLLTALARSLGIPARVVTGVVYVERLGGASRVFVPHAWSQAFIDGRWISFDSAQRRFDSTHIALGSGNGDPWRFFAAMTTLGHIRVDQAVPSSSIVDLPASAEGGFVGAAGAGGGR